MMSLRVSWTASANLALAMIKIASLKSSDRINFKAFVDFFYKADWVKFNLLFKFNWSFDWFHN